MLRPLRCCWHYAFRVAPELPACFIRPRRSISTRPTRPLVGFLILAVFGLVVKSFVRIAGGVLVFCFLVFPAGCGIHLSRRISNRPLIGWILRAYRRFVGFVFF